MESANVFAKMSGWEVTEIKGPEARDFLNRVTSANFKTLAPGSFTPATVLTGTGKLALYFKALALEPERYLLLVPAHGPTESGTQKAFDELERLHFRENLTITPLPAHWTYIRVLASDEMRIAKLAPVIPGKGSLKLTQDGRIVLNENRWCTLPVKLDLGILAPREKADAITQVLKHSEFDELPSLEVYRLRAGDPAVPAEINAGAIPLEAGLDDAVHENKGCYPGQEVIERIRAMGQLPRVLTIIRGKGEMPIAVPPNMPKLLAMGKDAGVVTSLAADPLAGGWIGLGYIKRVFADPEASYTVNSQEVNVTFKQGESARDDA